MTRRAGEGSARRVAGMDAGQFVVRTGCAVDKPRSPPVNPKPRLEGASSGGPSLWLFSDAKLIPVGLGQVRESNPASSMRSEARGRRARSRLGGNRAQSHWIPAYAGMTSQKSNTTPPRLLWRAFYALRACPAYAGMTSKKSRTPPVIKNTPAPAPQKFADSPADFPDH